MFPGCQRIQTLMGKKDGPRSVEDETLTIGNAEFYRIAAESESIDSKTLPT
jgi:hypothetical protein